MAKVEVGTVVRLKKTCKVSVHATSNDSFEPVNMPEGTLAVVKQARSGFTLVGFDGLVHSWSHISHVWEVVDEQD